MRRFFSSCHLPQAGRKTSVGPGTARQRQRHRRRRCRGGGLPRGARLPPEDRRTGAVGGAAPGRGRPRSDSATCASPCRRSTTSRRSPTGSPSTASPVATTAGRCASTTRGARASWSRRVRARERDEMTLDVRQIAQIPKTRVGLVVTLSMRLVSSWVTATFATSCPSRRALTTSG